LRDIPTSIRGPDTNAIDLVPSFDNLAAVRKSLSRAARPTRAEAATTDLRRV
jgi:hypothetical protein